MSPVAPLSPIPQIRIHLAPKQLPSLPQTYDDQDPHLLPPPTLSPTARLSPLRPLDATHNGKGLERARFEALLKASRERNASLASVMKKPLDLRKEVALKAHKSKQEERRAVFLSKIGAPPSPTATVTPATPPESPAVFHFSLPSPGLVSPLALFESLPEQERPTWVEHVDFRHQAAAKQQQRKTAPLPSLDQISARLVANAARAHAVPLEDAPETNPRTTARAPIPLPAFLTARSSVQKQASAPTVASQLPTPTPSRSPSPPRSARAQAMLERISRRVSAPAEMTRASCRSGEVFGEHRVLLVPGGF